MAKAILHRKGYKGPANVWEFEWVIDGFIHKTRLNTYYLFTDIISFKRPFWIGLWSGFGYADVTKKLRCTFIEFEDGSEYWFKGRK